VLSNSLSWITGFMLIGVVLSLLISQ
jgi:hypothetical protein